MRLFLLAALAAACFGCRSARRDEPRRDYMSLNRSSVAFLRETGREGRELRRANLKQTLAFSKRRASNKDQRKKGRRYAWESFLMGTKQGLRDMIRGAKREVRVDREEIGRSMRFGLLDSGD